MNSFADTDSQVESGIGQEKALSVAGQAAAVQFADGGAGRGSVNAHAALMPHSAMIKRQVLRVSKFSTERQREFCDLMAATVNAVQTTRPGPHCELAVAWSLLAVDPTTVSETSVTVVNWLLFLNSNVKRWLTYMVAAETDDANGPTTSESVAMMLNCWNRLARTDGGWKLTGTYEDPFMSADRRRARLEAVELENDQAIADIIKAGSESAAAALDQVSDRSGSGSSRPTRRRSWCCTASDLEDQPSLVVLPAARDKDAGKLLRPGAVSDAAAAGAGRRGRARQAAERVSACRCGDLVVVPGIAGRVRRSRCGRRCL